MIELQNNQGQTMTEQTMTEITQPTDAQGLREDFTAADMATASARGFRDGVASISAPLQSALDVIERWARDAYVVCGKPSTQEGFEAAWEAEDADAYGVWSAGRASLSANAGAARPESTTHPQVLAGTAGRGNVCKPRCGNFGCVGGWPEVDDEKRNIGD